jgi:hypothetical protein
MANYKDYSEKWRQGASAPTTRGVTGEAIKRDKETDGTISTVAGMALPVGGAVSGIIRGTGSLASHLGTIAYQGATKGAPMLSNHPITGK